MAPAPQRPWLLRACSCSRQQLHCRGRWRRQLMHLYVASLPAQEVSDGSWQQRSFTKPSLLPCWRLLSSSPATTPPNLAAAAAGCCCTARCCCLTSQCRSYGSIMAEYYALAANRHRGWLVCLLAASTVLRCCACCQPLPWHCCGAGACCCGRQGLCCCRHCLSGPHPLTGLAVDTGSQAAVASPWQGEALAPAGVKQTIPCCLC